MLTNKQKLSKWRNIKVYNNGEKKLYNLDDKEMFVEKFPKQKPRRLIQEISQLKGRLPQIQDNGNQSAEVVYASTVPVASNSLNPIIEPITNYVNNKPQIINSDNQSLNTDLYTNEPSYFDYQICDDISNQDFASIIDFSSDQDNDYFLIQDFSFLE